VGVDPCAGLLRCSYGDCGKEIGSSRAFRHSLLSLMEIGLCVPAQVKICHSESL